jgi:hypothetical protein
MVLHYEEGGGLKSQILRYILYGRPLNNENKTLVLQSVVSTCQPKVTT